MFTIYLNIMKFLETIKNNSITFFIYFILLFITGNGALDFYYRAVLEDHEVVVNREKQTRIDMEELLKSLNNIDLGFRGYFIVPNEELLHPYDLGIASYEEQVASLDSIMTLQQYTNNDFGAVKLAYDNYIKLMGDLVKLRDEGNLEEIARIIEQDPGFDVWVAYDTFNKKFQEDQLAIVKKSEARTNKIILISTIVRISLLLFGIPTLILVLFRLAKERNRRKALFADLDENNKKYLFDPNEEVTLKIDENSIITSLISNLRKASEFISSIAKGNYEAKWEGLNQKNEKANKENLVGELLMMRDQMVKVKEEDNIRMWVTEGISKFAEIVRQHQDNMEVLADTLTSNVANYLKVNQAFLYFVEEEEEQKVLKLFGCYAYDRKKFKEKTIQPGEGLVGQTYLEKEVTYIKDIPPNYVQITSGLGEATPTTLLIVPLKFNEQIEGVIELASFNEFKQYEIDFLERIGEIIASAIINIRASVKMKDLMQTMQGQSEEMKAQEEEMRQNMEELQATQEEVSRKAQEYQHIILEKDAIIEKKSKEMEELKKQIN